jgi:hypothetical protein
MRAFGTLVGSTSGFGERTGQLRGLSGDRDNMYHEKGGLDRNCATFVLFRSLQSLFVIEAYVIS